MEVFQTSVFGGDYSSGTQWVSTEADAALDLGGIARQNRTAELACLSNFLFNCLSR